jgi:hypothetical protein
MKEEITLEIMFMAMLTKVSRSYCTSYLEIVNTVDTLKGDHLTNSVSFIINKDI